MPKRSPTEHAVVHSTITRLRPLTAGQRRFAIAIVQQTANGEAENATHAYLTAFAGCAKSTANSTGAKLLRMPHIQAEIQRVRAATGITLPYVNSELMWCIQEAKKVNDVNVVRQSVVDLAKANGLIIEKSEVKNLKDEEINAIRREVSERLQVN